MRFPRSAAICAVWLFAFGPQAAAAQAPIDPRALGAALDELVPREMEARRIVGAVIAVVDRDAVLFLRGYGQADLQSRRPVLPERTTFRVASVSKLLTSTAAMQLEERGLLPLDEDVNRLLTRFEVPATFEEPITARHLLTHTAGLGERFLGSRSRTRPGQVPLGDYLAKRLPARFIAPGRIFSYANHGMALAGLLVESVSGLPFHAYVKAEILGPLRMRSSGFDMEEDLIERLATGYIFAGGKPHAVTVDFRNEVPSGSLVTTAADMARFARAFLGGGRLDGARVLEPETVDAMLSRQFSHHPLMDGVGLGFLERTIRGRSYLGHDGDIKGYNTRLLLAPRIGLGAFVAYTGEDDLKGFADAVTRAVFDPVYEPVPRRRLEPIQETRDSLRRLAGTYRWTRGAWTTMERMFLPYPYAQFRVSVEGGGLALDAPLGVAPRVHFEPAGPLLFQEVGGERLMSFRRDDEGEASHLLLMAFPVPMALERIGWVETLALLLALPLLGLALTSMLGLLSLRAWLRGGWSLSVRAAVTLFVAAGLGYAALLDSWNLLGYRL